ncbi:GNAT family N-acetyltransferase [Numidum massiliense]|uniref:GNAT family N-acetyltransferase n=1 Tax=Numidum massiliense TaxID=1522315 RepID=UPI000B2B15CD
MGKEKKEGQLRAASYENKVNMPPTANKASGVSEVDQTSLHIQEVAVESDHAPYDLLLLADPNRHIVDDYLSRGNCYVAQYGVHTVGVYVLLKTRPLTVEIVNIAVAPPFQGCGIGKQLVSDAIVKAKTLGATTVEIGTGNSSIAQLALYQKCGFRLQSVDRDFFLKHYEEDIFENGIQCVDMVRLALDI